MSQQHEDEEAFRVAVESLSPELLRIAFAFTRDADAAVDIVREAWRGTIRSGDSDPRGTAMRLVVDEACAATGKPGSLHRTVEGTSVSGPTVDPARFRPQGEQWAGHWVASPPTWPSGLDEKAALVAAALEALPEPQRVVVSLRDEQGCTAAEVCEYLAMGETEQHVLLHRGRARVRQVLEDHIASTGPSPGVA